MAAAAPMRPVAAALPASRPAAGLRDPAVAWDLRGAVRADRVGSAVDRVVAASVEAGAASDRCPHRVAAPARRRRGLLPRAQPDAGAQGFLRVDRLAVD